MSWLDKLKNIEEAPPASLPKLSKVIEQEQTIIDPKLFPHYCHPGDCHCSAKLPGADYPAECIWIGCNHYHASQDAIQTINEQQAELAPYMKGVDST